MQKIEKSNESVLRKRCWRRKDRTEFIRPSDRTEILIIIAPQPLNCTPTRKEND